MKNLLVMKFKEGYRQEKKQGGELKKVVYMQGTNMGEYTVVAHKSKIDEALTQTRNCTNACIHNNLIKCK